MSEWKPIETAPKDGTWIHAWRPSTNVGRMSPMLIVKWSEDESIWCWPDGPFDPFTYHGQYEADDMIESGDCFGSNQFTHWMPITAPPTT